MNIPDDDMPIKWQQRSANTFAKPAPIKKTPYSRWLRKRSLSVGAAAILVRATPPAEQAATASAEATSTMPMPQQKPWPLRLMYSYAHKDEKRKEELNMHLAPLVHEELVMVWSDREIVPGSQWLEEIRRHLEIADLIILVISAHFFNSKFCWSEEMKRAVERHTEGSARVIPVIVSHVDWQNAPIAKLQFLPKDAKPISSWQDRSKGWLDVAKGIRSAVELLLKTRASSGIPI
ncbi:MAG: toll/interleukin-1 receptor domain-containing protein [Silvibacterium sp.]